MGAALKFQNIFGETDICDRIVSFAYEDDWSHAARCNGETDIAIMADVDDYIVVDSTKQHNLKIQTLMYHHSTSIPRSSC